MRSVCAGFGRYPQWQPIDDDQVYDRLSGRTPVVARSMTVRYDNEQVVTFKRAKPNG